MAKKDRTAKRGHFPKKIGGVKLPKELRRSGDALIARAATPEGRRVIAAGLAMASAAVARAKVPPAPHGSPHVAPSTSQSGEGAPPPAAPIASAPHAPETPMVDPAQIAEAVGQAATAFFDGLFGRKR